MLAGANSGVLQAAAAEHMGGLGQAARDAALAEARAFRKNHPTGSAGASAAFDELPEIRQFAVRSLGSREGGIPGAAAAKGNRLNKREPDQEIAGSVCPGQVHRGQAVATPQTVKGDGFCWNCRAATWKVAATC